MLEKNRLSQRAEWAGESPISELMSRALANPDLISLAAGFVDQQSLPVDVTRMAFEQMAASDESAQAALQYGTTPGYPPLRELLLAQTLASDGQTEAEAKCSIDQLVVTAGSNQLLHLVSETLLNPGDIVLCSSPTYLVYMGVLANLGARAVGVASDDQGMVPAAIEEMLEQLKQRDELDRVKAIYLVPYFDNPRGINTPADRRREIVEITKRWSEQHKIYLIEDNAYRELRYSTPDIASSRIYDEDGDTVIVAGTFSKSYSPGIRVGWGILPPTLVEPVCSQKGNIDFGSPNFSQHLMTNVLASPEYEQHVGRIRASYEEKLQAMLAACHQHLDGLSGVHWIEPQGGLYVWLILPDEVESGPGGQLFDLAVKYGVLYVPGQYCFPAEGEPVRKNTIRLSFGVQTPEQIQRGIQALASALSALEANS